MIQRLCWSGTCLLIIAVIGCSTSEDLSKPSPTPRKDTEIVKTKPKKDYFYIVIPKGDEAHRTEHLLKYTSKFHALFPSQVDVIPGSFSEIGKAENEYHTITVQNYTDSTSAQENLIRTIEQMNVPIGAYIEHYTNHRPMELEPGETFGITEIMDSRPVWKQKARE